MKTFNLILSLVFLTIISSKAYPQNWPIVIGNDIHTTNKSLSEDYDNGYLLCNHNYLNASFINYGWLVKTDINGNMKWTKTFGDGEYAMRFTKAIRSSDQGIIISGSSGKFDLYGNCDPLFIKLNTCGEIEWCTIIHDELESGGNYGTGIIEISDGSLIGMVRYYGNQAQTIRISIIKFNLIGEPLWVQHLAQEDSVYNEEGDDLILTSDSNYLVAGHCSYSGEKPYFIKTDSDGNEVWNLKYTSDNGLSGNADQVFEDINGRFYAIGGGHEPLHPINPMLLKFDSEGNKLYHKFIIGDTVKGSGADAICYYNDTTLVIGVQWRVDPVPTGDGFSEIFVTDTLGNVKNRRLLVEQNRTPTNIIKTIDDKIVVTGHYFLDGNWDVYLWKMNSQLEDDSLYTQPMVYDSLCPDEIVSDTIDLDCGIYVDINEIPTKEEYENPLKIYPNPADQQIYLKVKSGQGKVVKVFDIYGRQITALTIPSIGDMSVNVSSWQKGLYLFSLFEQGRFVKSAKVIVR